MIQTLPASILSEGGYRVFYKQDSLHAKTGNVIQFGKENHELTLSQGILTPNEVHYIDEKIDDGNAKLGKVIASSSNPSADCDLTGNKALDLIKEEEAHCFLWLWLEDERRMFSALRP